MLLNLHRLEDWVPFSTLDYPGELSAVLFFKGCPYRCHYCHNPHLLEFNNDCINQPISPQSIELQNKFLPNRQKLLDAVVLSGGEPLFEKDITPLAQRLKRLGYKIGMHTAGSMPNKLKDIIHDLNWVGLDIKTTPEKYDLLTRSRGSWQKAIECLKLIQDANKSYECRVSTSPSELSIQELYSLTKKMVELGVKNWVIQELRSSNTNTRFPSYSPIQKADFIEAFESKFDSLVWRRA